MKKALLLLFLFPALLTFNSCEEEPPPADAPTTVAEVDIPSYMGLWYELASYPQWFNQNCNCTTAEYEILPSGKVKVTNKCVLFNEDGPLSRNVGSAVPVEGSNGTKLTVSFLPNNQGSEFGNYWVIELAEDYSYAVVSDPQREQWYLLSRTADMDPDFMDDIIERAVEDGFERDRIKITSQACD